MPPIVLAIGNNAIDTGVVAGDYASIQYVNWNTTYWSTLKTGTQWTLAFGTPAPTDGSGRLGYLPAAAPATGVLTLGDYLDELRRLLHDQNAAGDVYWETPDLIKDINKALRQRDLWSGGSLDYRQAVPLTIGQDIYSLATLFSDLTVLDVINIWLIRGQVRQLLTSSTFTDLTSRERQLTTYQNFPTKFTRRGPDRVYLAPKPATAYTSDWDLVVLSTTMVSVTDPDPLVFPYTEPVPYYAAYQACINARRWDLADKFLELFIRSMRDIEGSRVGEMMTYYEVQRGRR